MNLSKVKLDATQITAELGSKFNLIRVQSWTTLVQSALKVPGPQITS